MVPCDSSPVTLFALASAKNETPEEEAVNLIYAYQHGPNRQTTVNANQYHVTKLSLYLC